MLGKFQIKCNKKQINPDYDGKGNYLKYLDFDSVFASAMVQALRTDEISVCSNNIY